MEIKSHYLKRFKSLPKEIENKMILRGNLMIVEQVELEIKTAGGIILNADKSNDYFRNMHENAPKYFIVVKLGEGYEDGEPMECKEGDVVILPGGAVNYISYLGDTLNHTDRVDALGLARTSDSLAVFDGISGFKEVFKSLGEFNE